jgi:acetyl-CoA acetyltransferase
LGGDSAEASGMWAWTLPVGATSAVNVLAMYARRHMHEYGITREQLGWIAVTQRAHAALNPDAVFQAPLTIDEYLAARAVSTPLCLFDCDVPVDASTAFVISAVETVADLRSPVRIESMAQTCAGRPSPDQWEDLTTTAAQAAADRMWSRTCLKPDDVDVAQTYDGVSYLTLLWLEALGFCGRGESGGFVEGGARIGLGGQLPLNTWGGQLSAGRVHLGFGHLAEAIRQLRGAAGPRQVPDAEVAVVAVGGSHLASCMLVTGL